MTPDIIGFISQCESCGQRALTCGQHGADWLCPACTEPDVEDAPASLAELAKHVPVTDQHLDDPVELPEHESPNPSRAQDSVEHTCALCGRVGTRRFTETGKGWVCSPSSAEKCLRRQQAQNTPPPADDPRREHRLGRGLPGTASDIPAKPFQAEVTPPPATTPQPTLAARDGITARCTECPRTWNLTGRVLKIAIDTHEFQKQHIVDVHPEAYAS